MKTVVCFGASLTSGTVSFNYLELLGARPTLADFEFINHGVNGDLAWNGLQRLKDIVVEDPDFVIIMIGTNDVNATMSERNLAPLQILPPPAHAPDPRVVRAKPQGNRHAPQERDRREARAALPRAHRRGPFP